MVASTAVPWRVRWREIIVFSFAATSADATDFAAYHEIPATINCNSYNQIGVY